MPRLAIHSPRAAAGSDFKIFHHVSMVVTSLLHGRILLLIFSAYTPGKRILYVFTDNYSRLKPTTVFCRSRIQMRLTPTSLVTALNSIPLWGERSFSGKETQRQR